MGYSRVNRDFGSKLDPTFKKHRGVAMNSSDPIDAEAPAGKPAGLGLPAKLVLGTLAVCALAALFWPSGSGGTVKEPGGMLIAAHGRPAKLGQQLAPVSLVHFWATWCPPCITETPDLQ